MDKEVKIIDKTQTVLESIFKDIITFSFLIFCIWLSQDSKWWTFLTGTLFLVGFFAKVADMLKKGTTIFKSKKELLEWANSLEWPEK